VVVLKTEKHNWQIERHCSITSSAPGPRFFADARGGNFEKRDKIALKRIERQLKKTKTELSKKVI